MTDNGYYDYNNINSGIHNDGLSSINVYQQNTHENQNTFEAGTTTPITPNTEPGATDGAVSPNGEPSDSANYYRDQTYNGGDDGSGAAVSAAGCSGAGSAGAGVMPNCSGGIMNIQPISQHNSHHNAIHMPAIGSLSIHGGSNRATIPSTVAGCASVGGANQDFMNTIASAAAMAQMAGFYDTSSYNFKQEGRVPTFTGGVPNTPTESHPGTSSAVAHALALTQQGQRRPRSEKKPIPTNQKDNKYFERRKRNNLAAKKSRDCRKLREDEIALRASFLERENSVLRAQVGTLREEAHSLRQLLLKKRVRP